VPRSSEQTQCRSSTVNRCDKRRARPIMEGPQTSERVSRPKAYRDTKMDTKAQAPYLTLTFASSLPVMVWRGPCSQLAAQPALCFPLATRHESTSCRTYLFNNLDIFRIETKILFISLLYWPRICIFSVFKKLRQKSHRMQTMLVLSISEWSTNLADSEAPGVEARSAALELPRRASRTH